MSHSFPHDPGIKSGHDCSGKCSSTISKAVATARHPRYRWCACQSDPRRQGHRHKESFDGDQPRQTILVVRERRPLVRTNSRDARRKVTRERKVTEKPLALASTVSAVLGDEHARSVRCRRRALPLRQARRICSGRGPLRSSLSTSTCAQHDRRKVPTLQRRTES